MIMIKKIVLIMAVVAAVWAPSAALAGQKWQGTDDVLDGKMQQITGVGAREPLIDITQGNLGLFLFATGGFAAGAVFGYQWRKIFREKAGSKND